MTILIIEYGILCRDVIIIAFVLIICLFFCQIRIFKGNIFQSIIILFINSILTSYLLFSNINTKTEKYDLLPVRELTLKVKINKYLGKQVIGNETYHYNSGIVLNAPLVKKNLEGKEIRLQFNSIEKKKISVNKIYKICGLVKSFKENFFFERCILKENIILGNLGYRAFINNKIHNYIILSSENNKVVYTFINAIILGNKRILDEKQKTIFKLSGTLHLFAVSGLHIGFIYIILSFNLKLIKLRAIFRELIISLILIQYLDLVQYPPSAMRATIMILSWQFSKLLFKKNKLSSSLCLSAIIILILNPSELLTVGFQLSYTVVMSICIIYNRIFLFAENNYVSNYLSKSIKISYCAFIGSLLIIYDYFSIIVPGSIIMNVFIIPLTFLSINFIFIHFFIFFITENSMLLFFIENIYNLIEYILNYLTVKNLTYFETKQNYAKYDFIHFLYPLTFIFYKSFFKSKFLNFIYLCTLPILIVLIV